MPSKKTKPNLQDALLEQVEKMSKPEIRALRQVIRRTYPAYVRQVVKMAKQEAEGNKDE